MNLIPLRCGCKSNTFSSYCPDCGKYQRNLFLGEPFPNDFETSPLRQIAISLYSDYRNQGRMAGEVVEIPDGPDMWDDIKKAIFNSDICLFDVTLPGEFERKTFNPAFELGYSLGMPQGQKKYVLACNSGYTGTNPLRFFHLHRSIQSNIDHFNAWKEFREVKNWDDVDCNSAVKTNLKRCYNKMIDVLFKPGVENNIKKIYRGAEGAYKKQNKDVLCLTTNNFQDVSSQADFSRLNSHFITFPDNYFQGNSSINSFIKKLNNEIIKRYDYLIVHLRDDREDGVSKMDATFHNFKCGIIAGYMLARKEGEKEVSFLLHPDETPRSFSDYPGYPYAVDNENHESFLGVLQSVIDIINAY